MSLKTLYLNDTKHKILFIVGLLIMHRPVYRFTKAPMQNLNLCTNFKL